MQGKIFMNNLFLKKNNLKKVNLSFVVLTTLIILSLTPLVLFYLFTQKEIISELSALEEEQQLQHMMAKLDPLKTRIQSYKEMVGFVSQLPAVIEILNRGEIRLGSINKKTAHVRYAGVLTRAFEKYNDVVSIHILDLKENVQFSLLKQPETSKYHRVSSENITFNPAFLSKTLEMKEKGYFLSPLLMTDKNNSIGESPKLLLRIFSPIVLENEKVGIFCSDIDIGILAQSFPEIHWVLNDGKYLSGEKNKENAFDIFPSLQKIFVSDKAGVWKNDNTMVAWVPIFKGKDVSLVLWAGKKIDLYSVQYARKKMLINMFGVFLMLLIIIFSMSLVLSKYSKKVAAHFLENLEQSVIHQKKEFLGWNNRIQEFSDFSEKIAIILNKNFALEKKRQQTLKELQKSLDEIKTLRGIIPICSYCKKIRNDTGAWDIMEAYISRHSNAEFSHGICPECYKIQMEDMD